MYHSVVHWCLASKLSFSELALVQHAWRSVASTRWVLTSLYKFSIKMSYTWSNGSYAADVTSQFVGCLGLGWIAGTSALLFDWPVSCASHGWAVSFHTWLIMRPPKTRTPMIIQAPILTEFLVVWYKSNLQSVGIDYTLTFYIGSCDREPWVRPHDGLFD